MSTALPFASVGELVASPTESAAFGFRVARLSVGGAWAAEDANVVRLISRVTEALRQASEHTVIMRFPSELVEIARLDSPGGRHMQHAGTLSYWEDPLSDNAELGADLDAVVFSGGLTPPDEFVKSATGVIADSFDGYLNHYAYNVHIPAAIARDGYADWAQRTIADPEGATVLLRDGDEAIAVATLRFHTDGGTEVAEVELASVATARQGSGRYRDLWLVIRRTAREAGAERLIISTQASNIRVQRAWARLGLVPLAAFDTLHATLNRGI